MVRSGSAEDIKSMLEKGKAEGATHVIVVCDTFGDDYYPVNVLPGEDVREKAKELGYPGIKEMQQVTEVYSLLQPLEPQLRMTRAFVFD